MIADVGAAGHRAWGWLYFLLVSLTGLLGIAMTVLGGEIILLGGTVYYLSAGLLLFAGAIFAWFKRHFSALAILFVTVLLTLWWSLFEIHGKGWLPAWGFDFAARTGLIAALVLGTFIAFLFWQTGSGSGWRRGALGALAAIILAIVGLVVILWERTEEPATAGTAPTSLLPGGA